MKSIQDIPQLVDTIIASAIQKGASDIHIEPVANGTAVRFRIDGMLEERESLSTEMGIAVINRLMVMAKLLSYHRYSPQEGRATVQTSAGAIELRIATMPTLHGMRAAVRLPAELTQPRTLDGLGLDEQSLSLINRYIRSDSGVMLVVGPAGSGKTTTAYAILEAIRAACAGVSIVTLEDPVERALVGITQIPVTPFGTLNYASALRSMLRQDPQVLMLGEIRDAETASIGIEAALSGHRMICTYHAGDAAGAIMRLVQMGIEPYQIASCLQGVLSLRLVRRKTGSGYAGRVPICEAVRINDDLRQIIVRGVSAASLRKVYTQSGDYRSLTDQARRLIEQGITDEMEMRRVIGIQDDHVEPMERA